jgi:uncharacterized membrane protein YgdD (TMEM256/DUF423 family)
MRLDSARVLALSGALLALATLCGAAGTHALRAQLPGDDINVYFTADRYQFFHSLGLLGVGLAMRDNRSSLLRWSAWLLLVGIVCFCGTLYAVAFGAPRVLGAATAFGGMLLIVAWIFFAVSMWQVRIR